QWDADLSATRHSGDNRRRGCGVYDVAERSGAARGPARDLAGSIDGHGDELTPGLIVIQVMLEQVLGSGLRLGGRVAERHLRLIHRLSTLSMIAALARAHQILPRVPSATMLGEH